MKNLLDLISEKYKLSLQENLELGCNSDAVCIAVNEGGVKFVIKAAKTGNSIAEIKMNITGYKRLRECGLSFFIPEIIAYEIENEHAFMIMEYLGPNFLSQAKDSEYPMELYLSLMSSLEKVYSVSLKKDLSGGSAVESFIGRTIDIYERHVYPFMDTDRQLFSLLEKVHLSVDAHSIRHCCFSNWDFTLEDVYLTSAGVKYSDPHADIFGIPIIDMACFGGLVKLYGLPLGNEGYDEFRKFAIGRVAEILYIPPEQARKIFYLGKLFQCFMSIRFRHKENPEQSLIIFEEAKGIIGQII